jgi:hypothetical protein
VIESIFSSKESGSDAIAFSVNSVTQPVLELPIALDQIVFLGAGGP